MKNDDFSQKHKYILHIKIVDYFSTFQAPRGDTIRLAFLDRDQDSIICHAYGISDSKPSLLCAHACICACMIQMKYERINISYAFSSEFKDTNNYFSSK